jgi:long-chain fatty acid transport protein
MRAFLLGAIFGIATSLAAAPSACGQGVYISTGGPVNRGMGGASTAAPLDAAGALYWNPATISGLPCSELSYGMDILLSSHEVTSSIGGVTGTTEAETGVVPVPNLGWAYRIPDSFITLGVGVNAVAGFKTNLPADPTNPVLAPPPAGLGRVSSEAAFCQVTPVVSVAVTDNLSIAAGPVITLGQIALEPFVFDTPNANGYSPGQASRYHWGGGAQLGVYYIPDDWWHFGASIKSPTWMEEFRFFGQDAAGGPRMLHADIDLPMIVSLGAAFTGFENWVIAVDGRYFDYANTDGFGDPAVFDAAGELQGLDYSSIFALAVGVQRRVSEQFYLRGGYTYNQNPVADSEAFFNIASPLIYEHMISVGASYELTRTTAINVAYSHMLENSRTGPVVLPGVGAVPGSSFTNQIDAHFFSFGITMRN